MRIYAIVAGILRRIKSAFLQPIDKWQGGAEMEEERGGAQLLFLRNSKCASKWFVTRNFVNKNQPLIILKKIIRYILGDLR